jgi:hypothetical protein
MATDVEIKASREKARNAYGQVGYQGPASLLPGQTKPNIAEVSPPTPDSNANTNHADDQRRLDAVNKPGVPAHDHTPARTVSDGSPGGSIPKSTNHTAKR